MANRDDAFLGRTGAEAKPDPRLHKLCQRRLEYAFKRSELVTPRQPGAWISERGVFCLDPYVRYMLDAMKKAGW